MPLSPQAQVRQARGLPLRLKDVDITDLAADRSHWTWPEFFEQLTIPVDTWHDVEQLSHLDPEALHASFTRRPPYQPDQHLLRRPATELDMKQLFHGAGPLQCSVNSPLSWDPQLTKTAARRDHPYAYIPVGKKPNTPIERLAWAYWYESLPPPEMGVTWWPACSWPGICLHVQCLTVDFLKGISVLDTRPGHNYYLKSLESQNARRYHYFGFVSWALGAYDYDTNWTSEPAGRATPLPALEFYRRKSCPFCHDPWPRPQPWGCEKCGLSHWQIAQKMRD